MDSRVTEQYKDFIISRWDKPTDRYTLDMLDRGLIYWVSKPIVEDVRDLYLSKDGILCKDTDNENGWYRTIDKCKEAIELYYKIQMNLDSWKDNN